MSEQDMAARLDKLAEHAKLPGVAIILRDAAAELRRLIAEFRGAEDELKYQIRRAEQAVAERDKLAKAVTQSAREIRRLEKALSGASAQGPEEQ